MADNLKPYNPNKGFISFRLNPEALKEALIEQVPYNRTLRHIYNNPEGDIRETAKVAAYETPILGSLLAGEPVDAAKEAILFGAPIKAPAKAKAKIAKFKPGTEFGTARGYDDLILAKEPGSRKYKAYGFDYETGEFYRYNNSEYEGPSKYFDSAIKEDKPFNSTDLNKFIDNTNSMFDKVPSFPDKNPALIANDDIGLTYKDYKGDYHFSNDGSYHPLGNKIKEYNIIQDLYDQSAKAKPRKGEVVKVRMVDDAYSGGTGNNPYVVLMNPKTGRHRAVGEGYTWMNQPFESFRDLPDKNLFDYDKKLLQDEINQRNQRVDFEDDVIQYKSAEQYWKDLNEASDYYIKSMYGPFLEDILRKDR